MRRVGFTYPSTRTGGGEVAIPHLLQKSYTRPVRYKARGGQGVPGLILGFNSS